MKSLIDDSKELIKTVSTDFGRVFYSQPKGCAIPKSLNDLIEVVKGCYDSQTPIIPRGMSHSASGQCLSQSGVVIDMKQMNNIHDIEFDGEKGFIKADAGITWERLIKACLEQKAAPPVLTDWQKLTVGGTISTGGLGFMSHLYGIQADIVD
ncbi:MAG: FAD-dependent oxidoreductase [Okeania sp. SIO3I5]|uniref:FAD-binding oxidoreductase n=1 Tax=Okeania sp. SIO3I5 TaxID=2607805 RepID=UPI0013B973BC|nr:FAD-dependent oxidoreductase [Okeania sp. SIO3I5]NEQ34942.1 FAD-dependent oxidoreductase [Okeania sp. SIO3I5]